MPVEDDHGGERVVAQMGHFRDAVARISASAERMDGLIGAFLETAGTPEAVRPFPGFDGQVDPGNPRHWGVSPAEDTLTAMRRVAAAYDVPEEVILSRPEYDELIESTRAEFPYDPYDYGRRHCVSGFMRWTPPPDGEEVPRWLA